MSIVVAPILFFCFSLYSVWSELQVRIISLHHSSVTTDSFSRCHSITRASMQTSITVMQYVHFKLPISREFIIIRFIVYGSQWLNWHYTLYVHTYIQRQHTKTYNIYNAIKNKIK